MAVQGFEIRPFNLQSAAEHDYSCLNQFKNVLRHEVLPEDPLCLMMRKSYSGVPCLTS
jgi:hypothetical protein